MFDKSDRFKKDYVDALPSKIQNGHEESDFMIPLSEQYRINIKNAIELIDNTLELVKKSNVILSSKHLKEIRKAIAKKPYQKL